MKIDLGNCLILSPHADDWFLGCSSIVKRFSGCVVLMSYWAGEQQDIMVEFEECWKRTADRSRWSYKILNFPARKFDLHAADIRDAIYKYVLQLKPTAILVPAGRHPDHMVTATQADAATIHVNAAFILYYPDMMDRNPTPCHLHYLPPDEVRAKNDVWVDVWRTQAWRAQDDKRLDKPQLDELERFEVLRGVLEW
jgi:LmbE family N-acetylglucosaminyl deacetylase